jgi:hypothetical protein
MYGLGRKFCRAHEFGSTLRCTTMTVRFIASVEPPHALSGLRTSHSERGWKIEIENEVLTIATNGSSPEDELWLDAERELQLVIADLQWKLNGRHMSARLAHCERDSGAIGARVGDGPLPSQDSVSVTVRPEGASARASCGEVQVLIDGSPVITAYPVWSRNSTALRAREYYLAAEQNPAQTMSYLYKAVEQLKPEGMSWDTLAGNLNVSRAYLDYVKMRANRRAYDERHPPEPGDVPQSLPEPEIDECKRRVRDIIEKYAKNHPS